MPPQPAHVLMETGWGFDGLSAVADRKPSVGRWAKPSEGALQSAVILVSIRPCRFFRRDSSGFQRGR